jgi:hypothetical protein
VSLEQITAVCIGMTFNACTFVLGVLVGCSLRKRKDSNEHSDEGAKKDQGWWHHVERRHVETGTGSGERSGSQQARQVDPGERPAIGRRVDRHRP